jgi:hypothetical protein
MMLDLVLNFGICSIGINISIWWKPIVHISSHTNDV